MSRCRAGWPDETHEYHAGCPDAPAAAGRRNAAGRVLWFERIWPGAWPAILLAGAWIVVALFDLPALLPGAWHMAALAMLAAGIADPGGSGAACAGSHAPTRQDVDRRLEGSSSGLRHRPLMTLDDRPAGPAGTPTRWRSGRPIWPAPPRRSPGCASTGRTGRGLGPAGPAGAWRVARRGAGGRADRRRTGCARPAMAAPSRLHPAARPRPVSARTGIAGLDHAAQLHPPGAHLPETRPSTGRRSPGRRHADRQPDRRVGRVPSLTLAGGTVAIKTLDGIQLAGRRARWARAARWWSGATGRIWGAGTLAIRADQPPVDRLGRAARARRAAAAAPDHPAALDRRG